MELDYLSPRLSPRILGLEGLQLVAGPATTAAPLNLSATTMHAMYPVESTPAARTPASAVGADSSTVLQASLASMAPIADGERKVSAPVATLSLTLNILGIGVMLFPRAAALCGLLEGLAVLLAVSLFNVWAIFFAMKGCEMAEGLQGLKPGAVNTIEALATAALGPRGALLTGMMKNCCQCGTILVYTMLCTEFVNQLPLPGYFARFAVTLPLFLAIGGVKDLMGAAKLIPGGLVGLGAQMTGVVVGCVYMAVRGLHEGEATLTTHPARDLVVFDFEALISAASIFYFGMAAATATPTIRGNMEQPGRIMRVVAHGFAFSVAVAALIVVTAFLAFGAEAKVNVLDSMGGFAKGCFSARCVCGFVGHVGLMMNMVASTPLFLLSIFSSFERGDAAPDSWRQAASLANYLARAAIILLLVSLGEVLLYVDLVAQLMTSAFLIVVTFILPALFYHTLSRKDETRPGSTALTTLSIVCGVLLGLVVSVYGFVSTLAKLKVALTGGAESE